MKSRVEKFSGLAAYQTVSVRSEVETASPHRLIQMLLDGAVSKIAVARGCIERSDVVAKCENIDWAIAIVSGLRGSLDLEKGGEIADNLDRLYEYINRQLVLANLRNDVDSLDEVTGLLNSIRSGWAGIEPQTAAPQANAV